MNSEDGQVFSVWILQFSCFTKYTTVCSQNINKQSVNIADETLTDYSFLSKYHYTKSKNYLKRRYRIRHWIPMFIGTPCTLFEANCSQQNQELWADIKTNIYKLLIRCKRIWVFATYSNFMIPIYLKFDGVIF